MTLTLEYSSTAPRHASHEHVALAKVNIILFIKDGLSEISNCSELAQISVNPTDSIGSRLRLRAGQLMTSTEWSLNKSFAWQAVCMLAFSCWKIYEPAYTLLVNARGGCLNDWVYLTAFWRPDKKANFKVSFFENDAHTITLPSPSYVHDNLFFSCLISCQ